MSMILRTPSFRLDNKRALVIGASSGIGQGCAFALAEYGAEVTLAARRQQPLEQAAALINQHGGTAAVACLDVSDIARTQQRIVQLCQQQPFDILLNAAGLARHKPCIETTEEDFDMVSDVNIKSIYFVAQSIAKQLMAAGKPGSIITISSQMGHIGGIDRSVYCATKHAVEGMNKAMAIEWGKHNIRINTICPTFIKTELTQQTFDKPERVKWIKERIKLGRIGEVSDIMGAAVFLASDASAMITGTSLLIDGGWTAG